MTDPCSAIARLACTQSPHDWQYTAKAARSRWVSSPSRCSCGAIRRHSTLPSRLRHAGRVGSAGFGRGSPDRVFARRLPRRRSTLVGVGFGPRLPIQIVTFSLKPVHLCVCLAARSTASQSVEMQTALPAAGMSDSLVSQVSRLFPYLVLLCSTPSRWVAGYSKNRSRRSVGGLHGLLGPASEAHVPEVRSAIPRQAAVGRCRSLSEVRS